MRWKSSALIAALVLGVALFAAPAVSQAGTIDCLGVSNTIRTFTGGTGSACGTGTPTWTFTPITLAPGTAAIFTQNQLGLPSDLTGLPGFNLDTTDAHLSGGPQPNFTITVNGVAIPDLNILNFGGADVITSTTINEAHDWVLLRSNVPDGHGGLLSVYSGYADTLHSGNCADGGGAAAQPSQFCLPYVLGSGSPLNFWNGTDGSTAAAQFLGSATNIPGYPTSPHCNVNQTTPGLFDCFDAGAIMILEQVRVPEPSSLFLLGVSLMGVALFGRRHLKKNS